VTKNLPARLESEEVVLASPMSFTGSARRLWKLTRGRANPLARAGIYFGVILLIAAAWVVLVFWYCLLLLHFLWLILLVILYRLIRRGQRKRHVQELRHRELLTTIHQIDRELPAAGDGPPPARTQTVTENRTANGTARDEEGPDRPAGTTGRADA